ncbi:cytosine deaminase [Methylocaldum marinum]|uniref:Cytosine deaminase n=1 Tax=Methylocaldum marinum TaxID=1432792 RepID=A0A286P4A6_9GAMM|nr:cytosine deaminase [Methylocaldum marinum]
MGCPGLASEAGQRSVRGRIAGGPATQGHFSSQACVDTGLENKMQPTGRNGVRALRNPLAQLHRRESFPEEMG